MSELAKVDWENDCELPELDRGPKMTTLTGRMTVNENVLLDWENDCEFSELDRVQK